MTIYVLAKGLSDANLAVERECPEQQETGEVVVVIGSAQVLRGTLIRKTDKIITTESFHERRDATEILDQVNLAREF